MSSVGNTRLMCSSMVVLLIISVFQAWVCPEYACQAGAIRIFPGNGTAKMDKKSSQTSMGKMSTEELFRKYFNATSFGRNKKDSGLAESKRRIPSCPDPLHN